MHSHLEAARVQHLQGLLLPLSPRLVCDHLHLNWWAAAQLHKAGLLSFDPVSTDKLDERQEVELRFLGALVAAGCDHGMLSRLLAGLEKPYCYRPDRIYYDWASQSWSLLPLPPEEPDHETLFQDWLAQLAEEKDVAKLSELAEDIANTVKSLS